MKSLRLTATPTESHSRMYVSGDFDINALHVMVAGPANTGKTTVLAAIQEKFLELGIADSNIEIDSIDLENPKISYSERLRTPNALAHLKTQRYVLHEVHAARPLSLDPFDDLDRFKELVDRMSAEWVEKQGDVTCEFSTSSRYLDEKHRYLHSKAKEGVAWKIEYCDTCEKHRLGLNYHVGIVS